MPMLRCSATTCLYNKEEYCSKGDIMISGEQAKYADETNCASFVERKDGSAVNSTGCGCERINIQCQAHDQKTSRGALIRDRTVASHG